MTKSMPPELPKERTMEVKEKWRGMVNGAKKEHQEWKETRFPKGYHSQNIRAFLNRPVFQRHLERLYAIVMFRNWITYGDISV